MATLDSEPAFYRLSEELIIMIIEELEESVPKDHYRQRRQFRKDMQSIRLTHSRLAYSTYIQSKVFRKLRLNAHATIRDLRGLRKIAKFVRRVEFDNFLCSDVAKAYEYISSGKAELEWSEALQQVPNATDILILDYRSGMHYPIASGEWRNYVDMYRPAISAMVAAGTKPRSLEWEVNPWTDPTDPSKRWWERLDISSLETLRVNEWGLGPGKGGFLEHPLPSLAPFLKHLHVGKIEREFWKGTWPESKRPAMPVLESLELCGGHTDPAKLASWIGKCPKLSTLSLHGVYSMGRGTVDEWRVVFDAIRDHPKGMHVTMSHFVSLGGNDRLPRLETYTKDMPPPSDWEGPRAAHLQELKMTCPPTDEEGRPIAVVYNYELASRLMQYMCGLSEWNLQQWEGLL